MTITKQEYARRRKRLMAHMDANSIAILPSGREKVRSQDTLFPFRQDSDFAYLSGFPEPESVMVLIPGREHGEHLMFCREKDKEREIWDGLRAGPKGAVKTYQADDAFPIDDIDDILPGLIEGKSRVYYAMGRDSEFDRQVMDWIKSIREQVRSGATPPGEFSDLDHLLHDMRLFKSKAEIDVMQQAANISASAHCEAMKACKVGMYEYQLDTIIAHHCSMLGGRDPAYTTIVGGGANACILHYVDNCDKLKKGDLVLIDAGCEYQGYASDITRTFPVSGKFSKEQKAIYNLVLEAQAAALNQIAPGKHWNASHEASVQVITEGLIKLGLLKGSLKKNIDKKLYQDFYMHKIGHWIGMDVHDVGDYKVDGEWRQLEPNMVMTVEPGIYISPGNKKVDARWRGIGVRIEDDVVVTKEGHHILSGDVPKSVSEIERLMAS